jgi:hypothetical protein
VRETDDGRPGGMHLGHAGMLPAIAASA